MKLFMKKLFLTAFSIAGVVASLYIFAQLILAGYPIIWTGFGSYTAPNGDFIREKTLWDWMQLLIIPLVLAGGALLLNRAERKNEREIATDRQQEATLQAYFDRMTDLLKEERSLNSENTEMLSLAKIRTLTVLRGLNATRNDIVLRFLRDVGLTGKQEYNFFLNTNLQGADLESVDLTNVNMQGSNLQNANLQKANLQGANLRGANLQGADLRGANLYDTNLQGANLQSANLRGANVQTIILKGAYLRYTIMPDGTWHQ